MISVKKLFPYREDALGDKDKRKIAKMRTLVRLSAEENQKKYKKELKIREKEKELKSMSTKGKKYLEEYEEFMK